MYASTEHLLRRSRLRGVGVSTTAAGAAAGTVLLGPGAGTAVGSLLGGLLGGGGARLTSGVRQGVYNDEIGDSRMQTVIANGTLASYIANTMLAPANTPWGYAYSPEAVAWARTKLAQMTAGSQANAAPSSTWAGQVAAALTQAISPTPTPGAVPLTTASVTGGVPPLVLYAGLGLAALYFLKRRR
jgi:hypothetical protein